MPKCEVCNKKVKIVYSCQECGTKFCEKCGDKNKQMCGDCKGYESEVQGSYRLEQQEIDMED